MLRVAADPEARNRKRARDIPAISGRLKRPVLTIHTLGDLFVPFSMEQIYARRAARHERSHWLVQRAIREVGHCAFTPQEAVQTFSDLVNWVNTGVPAAGDNVVDPETVAGASYGCQFTNPKNRPSLLGLGPVAGPCP